MRSRFSSSRTENSSRPTGRSLPRAKADAMGAAAVNAKNERRERESSVIIGKANDTIYQVGHTLNKGLWGRGPRLVDDTASNNPGKGGCGDVRVTSQGSSPYGTQADPPPDSIRARTRAKSLASAAACSISAIRWEIFRFAVDQRADHIEFGQGQSSCPVYFLAEQAQHSRRFASGRQQSIGGVEAIADSLFD